MNLTTATPAEIDAELAEIYGRIYTAQAAWLGAKKRLADMTRANDVNVSRFAYRYTDADFAKAQERIETTEAALDAVRAETAPYDAEYDRRGGWTRAFLVTTTGVGHVHSSTRCSTCFPTTEFGWLTELSGKTEAEIVAAAGADACTVCYPSAPVDTAGPRSVYTKAEKKTAEEKAARQAELDAKRAAKAAKAITAEDGTPLRGSFSIIATERTAEIECVDKMAQLLNGWTGARTAEATETVERILRALASKRGTTVEEQRAALTVKAEKKARREARG